MRTRVGPRRRQLRPQRLEDLGHQRAGCRPVRRLRARSIPARGVMGICGFIVEEGYTRSDGRPEARQDGPAHVADVGDLFQGLPHSRRRATGTRRIWRRGLQLFDGLGTGEHPGDLPGHDAAAIGAVHRVRAGPQAVRAIDRQVPVGGQSHRRHEDSLRDGAPAALQSRLADADRASRRTWTPRWRSSTSRSRF